MRPDRRPTGHTMLTVASLHIYPVKGLKGLDLDEAAVEPWGLARDRRWMVVDADGRFLTQRQEPRLARIAPELRPSGIRLGVAGQEQVDIAFPSSDAEPVSVVIWSDTVMALPAGPAADAWLTAALGRPCRLVYMADPHQARAVDPAFGAAGDTVSFADGFPLLVTNQGSLDDLNQRLIEPVPMTRFRTNVLVAGAAAWAEDGWRRIAVGDVVFRVVKDCARCAVTTVDQATAERSPRGEPLRTLATFRRRDKNRIIFGQNLVPDTRGVLRVGDPVVLLD